jgi:hypothetical protein
MSASAVLVLFRRDDLHRMNEDYQRIFVATTQEEIDEAVDDLAREGYNVASSCRIQLVSHRHVLAGDVVQDFNDLPIGRVWKPGSPL